MDRTRLWPFGIASAVVAAAALGALAADCPADGPAGLCQNSGDFSEESSLLALRSKLHRGGDGAEVATDSAGAGAGSALESVAVPYDAAALAGKSIYFLLTDRFARSNGNETACLESKDWCNGTLKGVIQQLDYIQGMGFDCIWMTPVVKQAPDFPDVCSGASYHGYWAQNLYDIDPHYGSPDDLKQLSDALHERDMCLVMDTVVNHMGSILSTADAESMSPFNLTSDYHTLDIGDRTFDEYVKQNPPTKGGFGLDCSNFTQVQALGPEATGSNEGQLFGCQPGDFFCPGYNETRVHSGWFFALGDLNQTVPHVRQETISWMRWLVETYSIDAIRLDTAPYVPNEFLAELQDGAGAPIMGEVTASNMSFHASFQKDSELGGRQVLAGILNFPVSDVAKAAFCNTTGTLPPALSSAAYNLSRLGADMTEQYTSGLYSDLDTLGNFVDNHDWVPRIDYLCKGNTLRIRNALAWVMLARGAPIVYYGTEQGFSCDNECRESLWQTDFNTHTELYKFFKATNEIRRKWDIATAPSTVLYASNGQIVFSRGDGVFVYLNNQDFDGEVSYQFVPPAPKCRWRWMWVDALSGEEAHFRHGRYVAKDAMPKVLVQKRRSCFPGKRTRH